MRLLQTRWTEATLWFLTMESWVYALNPPRSDFGICNSGKKIGDKAQMTQQAEQVGINEGLTSSSMLKK